MNVFNRTIMGSRHMFNLYVQPFKALLRLYRVFAENPESAGLGIWGPCFVVNVEKRVAQKLRRIILLHSRLVSFRSHFPKVRKVIIFMIFGPSGNVHDSQIQLCLTLETLNDDKVQETSLIMFENIICGNSQISGIKPFRKDAR